MARKTEIWKHILFLVATNFFNFWHLLNLLINIGIQSIYITCFKTSFGSKRTSSTCVSDYDIVSVHFLDFFEMEHISHKLSNVANSMNGDKNVGNFMK